MNNDSAWRSIANSDRATALERRWKRLCSAYLPHAPAGSIWTYRYAQSRPLPDCGWKLHVSATILNAPRILGRVAPVLIASGVQFKAARSLSEVIRLNSGLLHTYSQVGKVITVYPRNDNEAVRLAQQLDKLTRRFQAPSVPFDLRFAKNSNVYYRYGAFKRIQIEQENGQRVLGIPTPAGELVPDVRERAKPDWVHDPFESNKRTGRRVKTQDETVPCFHVLRALVQRGKGGVYQAIDFSSGEPRLCLLKEGRKHGELTWDGRDGAWRVRNEERVLSHLLSSGITVPEVHARFELGGSFYLVMEFVDGESLHNVLLRQTKRFPLTRVLAYGIQIANFLAHMHCARWAWRDCKPKNLIVTRQGTLVPIDFEGAEQIDRPDPVQWGTRGFMPGADKQDFDSGLTDDLYALGAVLYLLITGRICDAEQPIPIAKLRRGVPVELRRLVELLMADRPQIRPRAHRAKARLTSILLKYSSEPVKARSSAKAA